MVIDTYSLATQGQNSFDTYAIATMGYNDLMVDSRFVVFRFVSFYGWSILWLLCSGLVHLVCFFGIFTFAWVLFSLTSRSV